MTRTLLFHVSTPCPTATSMMSYLHQVSNLSLQLYTSLPFPVFHDTPCIPPWLDIPLLISAPRRFPPFPLIPIPAQLIRNTLMRSHQIYILHQRPLRSSPTPIPADHTEITSTTHNPYNSAHHYCYPPPVHSQTRSLAHPYSGVRVRRGECVRQDAQSRIPGCEVAWRAGSGVWEGGSEGLLAFAILNYLDPVQAAAIPVEDPLPARQ
jgi:hypothetical protein